MKYKINIGIKVQVISIVWFFNKDKFKNLFIIKSKIKYNVNEVIIIINNVIKLMKWN